MGPTLSTAPGSGRLASPRVSSHGKSGALLERREITTGTAFRGPGEQDAFGFLPAGVTSVVERGRVHPDRRLRDDVVLLVCVLPTPERKAPRTVELPVPLVREAHGGRALDDERLEVLRADGVLALLGVAHHGLDVPVREDDLPRLLVEAEMLARSAEHDDLRIEAALHEEGAHRAAGLRGRDTLAGPELVEERRALFERQLHRRGL